MKSDGRPAIVRMFAQDEWVPLVEGKRWWVEVDGHARRLDTYGFESNYGPLYQSPQGDQVIAFSTFRNNVEDGLCFDLATGEVSEVRGKPVTFEADGWKKLTWGPVREPN